MRRKPGRVTAARIESASGRAARALRIAAGLARLYPQARISLDFQTPWQCLAATILSAQCTDERVNRVTPRLFAEIPDPAAMAAADLDRIERLIVTTGFFRNKARSLKGAAQALLDRFGAVMPDRMEDLLTIPGVGRKTANVVIGHVFGGKGMVVDTHVRRLSRRMGLSRNGDPDKIERDLQKLIPARDWTPFSMRMILHGRRVCSARNPRCDRCAIAADCPRIGLPAPAL
ncbi:MAG: endonuclease III [Candidatus Binataceae bacterium]